MPVGKTVDTKGTLNHSQHAFMNRKVVEGLTIINTVVSVTAVRVRSTYNAATTGNR